MLRRMSTCITDRDAKGQEAGSGRRGQPGATAARLPLPASRRRTGSQRLGPSRQTRAASLARGSVWHIPTRLLDCRSEPGLPHVSSCERTHDSQRVGSAISPTFPSRQAHDQDPESHGVQVLALTPGSESRVLAQGPGRAGRRIVNACPWPLGWGTGESSTALGA